MGFEIVWMRILFAIAVFQTMPLGGTWANWAYLELREAKAHWFENGRITEEADLAFRPPFLPSWKCCRFLMVRCQIRN